MHERLSIDLLKQAGVLLVVKAKTMCGSKQIKNKEKVIQEHIQKNTLTVSKEYIHRDYLKPILQVQNKARNWLDGLTVGVKFDLLVGTYFIPNAFIDEVRQKCDEFLANHTLEVDILKNKWPEVIEEARDRLDPELFNPADYTLEIGRRFKLSFKEFHIVNAGSDKLTEEIEEFAGSVGVVLRKQMSKLLESAVGAFSIEFDDEGNAKRGKLSSNLFNKFQDFFKLVEEVNGVVTKDDQLANYVSQIKTIIQDEHEQLVDINKYKKDDDWRLDMSDSFADIYDAFSKETTQMSVDFFEEEGE